MNPKLRQAREIERRFRKAGWIRAADILDREIEFRRLLEDNDMEDLADE